MIILPETTIAPENRPSQKEIHLPTIHFSGAMLVSWRASTYTPFKHLEAHMKRTSVVFSESTIHHIGLVGWASLEVAWWFLNFCQCPLLWRPARCSREVLTLPPTVMEKEYDVWQVHFTHLPCSELEKKNSSHNCSPSDIRQDKRAGYNEIGRMIAPAFWPECKKAGWHHDFCIERNFLCEAGGCLDYLRHMDRLQKNSRLWNHYFGVLPLFSTAMHQIQWTKKHIRISFFKKDFSGWILFHPFESRVFLGDSPSYSHLWDGGATMHCQQRMLPMEP